MGKERRKGNGVRKAVFLSPAAVAEEEHAKEGGKRRMGKWRQIFYNARQKMGSV